MAADASDPAAYKALVDEKMMIIFEACSFQDITGQRIAKVVETLQHIEQRVARFADVMKAKDIEGFLSENERARNERKEKYLLNGPQLAGEGVDQSRRRQDVRLSGASRRRFTTSAFASRPSATCRPPRTFWRSPPGPDRRDGRVPRRGCRR